MLRAGAGFAMLYEGQAREDVSRGELVPILEEFCPPFAGFYLFYPQRRHASQALRAFIEHLRLARQQSPRRSKPSERRRGGV
jgi:DNA-binding transcriptional LysR family regulator